MVERLRSLRRLRAELWDAAGGSLLAEGELQPQGGGGTAPVPLPIITNAPSAWRRLTTAAAVEGLMARELVAG